MFAAVSGGERQEVLPTERIENINDKMRKEREEVMAVLAFRHRLVCKPSRGCSVCAQPLFSHDSMNYAANLLTLCSLSNSILNTA